MDGKTFDTLTRTAANGTTRRGTLGLLAGAALAAGLAKLNLADAKKKGKGKNKNKKCRKLNQSCGGKKKKCCKGLSCTDGTCLKPASAECDSDSDCAANEVCQNGQCVPEAPGCENNNDCANDEICLNGVCIPETPECENDNDCDNDEICLAGECAPEPPECDSDSDCGSPILVCQNGQCVFEPECELDTDCPPNFTCKPPGICRLLVGNARS